MEHHSNLLPWRELGNVDIVTIRLLPKSGQIDLQHLESILQQNVHRTIKIGSFAAASNITGTVVDDRAITALLHQYGALSVWDYATGACIRTVTGHQGWVTGIVVDSNHMYTSSWDKTVRQTDLETGNLLREFVGHSLWVTSLALRDGHLFTSSADCTVIQWNVETGER